MDNITDGIWSNATPCENRDRAIEFVNALYSKPTEKVLAIHFDVKNIGGLPSTYLESSSVQDAEPTREKHEYDLRIRKHIASIFGPEHVFVTHDIYARSMACSVAAVIVKDKKILASATNIPPIGARHRCYTGHAEYQVISKLLYSKKRLQRKYMTGLTLYVLRFTQDGSLAMASQTL